MWGCAGQASLLLMVLVAEVSALVSPNRDSLSNEAAKARAWAARKDPHLQLLVQPSLP